MTFLNPLGIVSGISGLSPFTILVASFVTEPNVKRGSRTIRRRELSPWRSTWKESERI